jgi:thiol-disulfide isomerase/thioredoxin
MGAVKKSAPLTFVGFYGFYWLEPYKIWHTVQDRRIELMCRMRRKLAAPRRTVILPLLALFSAVGAGIGMPAPEIGGQSRLNSEPLRIAELKRKVVLVEFWTFGCYNCLNVQPYVKGWHQKYSDKGLVVIGVRAPEFNSERVLAGVQRYVRGTPFDIRSPSTTTSLLGSGMEIATGRPSISSISVESSAIYE